MTTARDLLRAGLRGVFDGRIWLQLVRAGLSLAALARAVATIVLVLLGAWVMLMLPAFLKWLPAFVIAAWLTPVIMRRASAIIARRVVAARPGAPRMAARPLPSAGTYRVWWLPLVLCDAALPPLLDRLQLPGRDGVLLVALLATATAAPGAIVRSVLAPWFAIADIDRALAARRGFWALVALGYVLALGLLQWIAVHAAAIGGLGSLVGAIASRSLGDIVSALLLECALAFVAFLAVGIFCTSALAWLAAKALAGDDACVPGRSRPSAPVSADESAAPPPSEPSAEARAAEQRAWAGVLAARPTPQRPPPPPPPPPPAPSPARVKAARALERRQWVMVALFAVAALVLARESLAPWFLGPTFRESVDNHGDWMDLAVRAQVRTDMACLGRTRTLRVLSWLDVGVVPGPQNAALGCAALHGHLETVQALVALGEDIDRPATANVAPGSDPVAPQTPLQQAVRTPTGLPVAEWLLAHGARPEGTAQAAAAANCLPCLAWLKQHGVALGGTAPSTPLALWLDNFAQKDSDDAGMLSQLIDLGLSPSAVGADGRSALHAAAAAANGAAVDLLMRREADPALADRDGMKPVFYAAVALAAPDPHAGAAAQAQRARRLAVVLQLVAATPSLAGQAVPAHPRRAVMAFDPYISRPFDFGMAAALEPAIRAAAAQAGKPIHYAQADFIADLPPAEARALLDRMDDAEIAAALAPRSRLARRAATASWWPELARAARGWPRPPPYMADSVEPDCPVLGLAVAGAGDTSPGAGDSWAVVDAWLAAGMKFAGCPREVADALPFDVARRAAAQRQDWLARTTPSPRP